MNACGSGNTCFRTPARKNVGEFLMSATCFPFGGPRDVWRTAFSAWRAGAGTIPGAIRYAHLELDRQMRKYRERHIPELP